MDIPLGPHLKCAQVPFPRCPGYMIESLLGRGGFSHVYLAIQESSGQKVALKVLRHDEFLKAEEREQQKRRFLQEAKLCAALRHPDVVRLLDQGWAEIEKQTKPQPFVVFEYLPGETLRQHLTANGPLSPVAMGTWMGRVLSAMVCLHKQGVLHRDLKPSNLMLYQDRPQPSRKNFAFDQSLPTHIKILDLGIAAWRPPVGSDEWSRLTLSGETLGTPLYTAPEILRGGEASTSSDLYAWGLIVLECLSGQPVMQGYNQALVIQQQMSSDVVPLLPALVEHPLGDLLRAELQKDPKQRLADTKQAYDRFAEIRFEELVGDLSNRSTAAQ